ncbi:uncharacterized protein PAN0_003d1951 [Moesziomyces antarcticus]|uniref:Uncharacterized protein n=1 Tax=Pseudozyma antarctica TaxID=84753 RepID=A0A5C3FKM5_PSEA2|nr:uncharacterized protein PAN0_003d1951 [Moesziomyces antarcticus]GAK63743.1 conserved hypothetical protein [Moesziomyces antarcticus]SPO44345.1 uncharacterized protein PSANT_02030 [Moesziomyces antarcticus]
MVHILKNPDGTVNFDAVQKETAFLKGKYAQNAENIKKNTAHEEQLKQQSAQSSAPEQKHGDIVAPKADSSHSSQ